MKRIFAPTTSPLDWKPLLSRPDLHWKPGFSAMTLARSWEASGDRLPKEIAKLIETAHHPAFTGAELLLAIPEHCVQLPGGVTATQTDVFALIRGEQELGVLAIEGKVDESLGPTVEAKQAEGATERLAYLHKLLALSPSTTSKLRYQLVHRTAAALLLAKQFHAKAAAMIVHSFSPTGMWYSDFVAFAQALECERAHDLLPQEPEAAKDVFVKAGEYDEVTLFVGWARGASSIADRWCRPQSNPQMQPTGRSGPALRAGAALLLVRQRKRPFVWARG